MQFVQARNYTPTNGRQIDLIVIHDMESAETATTAEQVAQWFAGSSAPRASAHYNIDNNSIVQSVRDQDVAWHAPGANHNGIGLEHAGRAAQSQAEWLDPYSLVMLRDQSAPLTRDLCQMYHIPIRYVDAAGLLRGERGITTHHQVSLAFKKSTHTDPGPNFPMAQYLAWVANTPAPEPPEEDMTPEQDQLLRAVHTELVARASAPVVKYDANGKRLVFVQGVDRALFVKTEGVDTWVNLQGKLREPLTTDQIAVAPDGRVTVVIKGDDDAAWLIERNAGGTWGSWRSLGGLVD